MSTGKKEKRFESYLLFFGGGEGELHRWAGEVNWLGLRFCARWEVEGLGDRGEEWGKFFIIGS